MDLLKYLFTYIFGSVVCFCKVIFPAWPSYQVIYSSQTFLFGIYSSQTFLIVIYSSQTFLIVIYSSLSFLPNNKPEDFSLSSVLGTATACIILVRNMVQNKRRDKMMDMLSKLVAHADYWVRGWWWHSTLTMPNVVSDPNTFSQSNMNNI